jgi:23S rRNA-/tRNA-specific pseudouridylate synthase
MVVDKPVGLPTQAPPGIESLESQLRSQIWTGANPRDANPNRGGYLALPHRLDVPVGGVILIALTKKAARLFSEQFAARTICKTYHAIVSGNAAGIETTWSDSIRKIPDQARVEVIATDAAGGKIATTQVRQVDHDPQNQHTRLVLAPHTGRMHQLRIGAASRGFPIIGDRQYGGLLAESIQLRAVEIEFRDPSNGKQTRVTADPLPWPLSLR